MRDAGMTALMADARMKTLKMPFDGQRMNFGGFSPIVEKESAKGTSYADGFVVPVQAANRDAYTADSDSVNLGSNPGPQASYYVLDITVVFVVWVSPILSGIHGVSWSRV
ncbi:MAG: hypothetical protein H0U60_06010 [Blastocatellia bacterium]|nr:hypothetical protein [Blastocatellia bacterium]